MLHTILLLTLTPLSLALPARNPAHYRRDQISETAKSAVLPITGPITVEHFPPKILPRHSHANSKSIQSLHSVGTIVGNVLALTAAKDKINHDPMARGVNNDADLGDPLDVIADNVAHIAQSRPGSERAVMIEGKSLQRQGQDEQDSNLRVADNIVENVARVTQDRDDRHVESGILPRRHQGEHGGGLRVVDNIVENAAHVTQDRDGRRIESRQLFHPVETVPVRNGTGKGLNTPDADQGSFSAAGNRHAGHQILPREVEVVQSPEPVVEVVGETMEMVGKSW